jgi:acyl-CoA synthetase (AMP-forming)/AMP-acid ligase II
MTRVPGRLYQRFRQQAQQHPARPAFTFLNAGRDPVTYTFGRLFERAEKLAENLGRVPLDDAAPLGLLLRTQEGQVLHYLAALSLGLIPAILTPPNRKLNKQYYVQTMAAVLERIAFGAVVTDVEGMALRTPALAPETFAPLNDAVRPPDPAADRPQASFLQFSSGTTGIKRGVMVTDDAVLAQLNVYAKSLALDERDCIVSWLPLYHDMGFIACLNMPLACGVPCVMLDPIDWVSNPVLFLRAVSQHGGTLAWHPNFAYAFMAQRVRDEELAALNLSSLRGLINCSEPVTHESQQRFADRFAPCGLRPDVFLGCYAMAETTYALTHGTMADAGYHDRTGPEDVSTSREIHVSVGRPLPGVELTIRDAEGRPLPDRRVGEIWVRSPFNFTGYHRDAEATAKAFHVDWYKTGDLGYRVGDAYYVSGRKKDVLIVGGVNVFPQDIEDLVSQVEGVRAGRVSAFSHFDAAVQTERVVILAESDHHADATASQRIVLDVRQRILACFQIANFEAHLVAPEWLVKSSSGKMARGANQKKWAEKE